MAVFENVYGLISPWMERMIDRVGRGVDWIVLISFIDLFGFLKSSSAASLSRGRVPGLTS